MRKGQISWKYKIMKYVRNLLPIERKWPKKSEIKAYEIALIVP